MTEGELYKHPDISQTLPPLVEASDNANGAVRSPSGFVYPPYIIMERGITLSKWRQDKRTAPAILNMLLDVAAHLARLHDAGHVHRDLKPGVCPALAARLCVPVSSTCHMLTPACRVGAQILVTQHCNAAAMLRQCMRIALCVQAMCCGCFRRKRGS